MAANTLGSIYLWSPSRRLDPDADNFLTRAGITDASQRAAVNVLATQLKAASLWTLIGAFYPFVGGTAGAHAQNLKSSSFTISWSGTVTHNANGITGNGTDGWGDTGWDSTANASQNSVHGYCYCRTAVPTADGRLIGVANAAGTSRIGLVSDAATNNLGIDGAHNGVTGLAQVVSTNDLRGSSCISRTAGTTNTTYLRAITPVVDATASVATCGESVGVLARNFESFGPDKFSDANLAAVCLGTGLSGGEYASLATIVQTYQTSLGRNV